MTFVFSQRKYSATSISGVSINGSLCKRGNFWTSMYKCGMGGTLILQQLLSNTKWVEESAQSALKFYRTNMFDGLLFIEELSTLIN